METVEIRCPVGPRRLFSKLRIEGEPVHIVGNLIEFACADCRRFYKERYGETYSRVLHRFNLLGEFVETEREK